MRYLSLDQNIDYVPVSLFMGHNKNIILKVRDVSFCENSQGGSA